MFLMLGFFFNFKYLILKIKSELLDKMKTKIDYFLFMFADKIYYM